MLLQKLGEIQGECHAVDGEGHCQTPTWYGHTEHPDEGPHFCQLPWHGDEWRLSFSIT